MSFESWHIFLSVWLLITTILLALFYRPRSRTRREAALAERGALFGPVPKEGTGTAFLTEKRTSLRREGNPVSVLLADDTSSSRTFTGEVIDRSTTGLRLMVNRDLQPGCVLRVLAENAPNTTPWIYVQVCRAEKTGRNNWEVGCRFSETPPWSILLLFG